MSEGGSRKWKLRNGWGKVGLRKTHHPNRCGRPQLIFKEQTAPDPSVLCPIKEQRCASRYGHPIFPINSQTLLPGGACSQSCS